ncbi:MAG: EAL domain-containing protein [Nitrospirae bacterium]|nr:EAL domain-containing protein [Nitrospirota bacterium]
MSNPVTGTEASDKRSTILKLRWLLVLALGYLLLFRSDAPVTYGPIPWIVLAYLLSNAALVFLPGRYFLRPSFDIALILVDTVIVSTALSLAGFATQNLFVFYFLIMLLTTLGKGLGGIIANGLIIVGIYFTFLVQSQGWAVLTHSGPLLQIPFLIIATVFYGVLVDRERGWYRKTLDQLQTASEAVAGRLELDAMLKTILDAVTRLLGADTVSVMLLEPDGRSLRLVQGKGIPYQYIGNTVVKIGEGVAGRIAETGQPLLLQGSVREEEFRNHTPFPRSIVSAISVPLKTRGYEIGVPLKTEGRVIGVLNASIVSGTRQFNRQDLRLLTLFASNISTALEQARLIEELLRKTTEHERAERKALEDEARFRGILDIANEAVISIDETQRILLFNKGAEKTFGYSSAEVIGRSLDLLLPERFAAVHQAHVVEFSTSSVMARRMGERREICGRRKNGGEFPAEASISRLELNGEKIFTVVLWDITERKKAEETIRHQAYHDLLTDLPNRLLCMDRLTLALSHADRYRQKVAVMFVDLDRFKLINDSMGHEIGDRLLKNVAERLIACLRKSDTVARMGGDEFMLLLPELRKAEDAAVVAHKILEAVEPPFNLEDREFYLTASIGISLYPDDGEDAQTLVKSADTAMYRAKEQGRNHYQFFSSAMKMVASERLALENSLRRALERREFMVHYQPQIHLPTGEITGMEALARWQHPERGLVSPAQFIPLAEETGLIVPIGEWVLRTACAQTKAWKTTGAGALRITVNLSVRQFRQKNLAEIVGRVLAETGLDPSDLVLELTEGSIMQNVETTIAALRALKTMGVRISIDDFGTGYSSLNYLKRFPVDILKIDQSFVRNITNDPGNAAIATAIVAMAHSLKMEVIAEGVETADELAFLRSLRCDGMQGYLYSKPVAAEAFTKLLSEGRRLA